VFGDNLKLHFAGAEQVNFAMIAQTAGVKYFLFTVFLFICEQFGIKHYSPPKGVNFYIPSELCRMGKHVIMDSGLFTLMFGSKAGNYDKQFLERWMYALAQTVIENQLSCTCVEVDCQKVLGVEEAWYFRNKLRSLIPNNRIINVFHLEDGKKGLDRLIEFSDYTAISVPELRIHKSKTYKEDVYKLAHYMKNRKPDIDIHLLGCTESGLLKKCKFCTTSDSTSWLMINRYGQLKTSKGMRHVSGINTDILNNVYPQCRDVLTRCNIEVTGQRLAYLARYYISAQYHKSLYANAAGNQD